MYNKHWLLILKCNNILAKKNIFLNYSKYIVRRQSMLSSIIAVHNKKWFNKFWDICYMKNEFWQKIHGSVTLFSVNLMLNIHFSYLQCWRETYWFCLFSKSSKKGLPFQTEDLIFFQIVSFFSLLLFFPYVFYKRFLPTRPILMKLSDLADIDFYFYFLFWKCNFCSWDINVFAIVRESVLGSAPKRKKILSSNLQGW